MARLINSRAKNFRAFSVLFNAVRGSLVHAARIAHRPSPGFREILSRLLHLRKDSCRSVAAGSSEARHEVVRQGWRARLQGLHHCHPGIAAPEVWWRGKSRLSWPSRRPQISPRIAGCEHVWRDQARPRVSGPHHAEREWQSGRQHGRDTAEHRTKECAKHRISGAER